MTEVHTCHKVAEITTLEVNQKNLMDKLIDDLYVRGRTLTQDDITKLYQQF